MTQLQRSDAHQDERNGFVPATLTERFFGRMAINGLSFQIYLEVVLDGQLDRDALAVALRRTIADYPRLGLRLTPYRWGLRRRRVSPDAIDASRLIRYHATADELAIRRGDPLDLTDVGPIRLDVLATGTTTRLLIVAHHAMTDARGALAIYDRLADRYIEALGGPAPKALLPATDARRRRLLDGAPLSLRLAVAASILAPIREMIPGMRPVPGAKFYDEPSTEGSVLHTQHLTVPPALVTTLVRTAARQTASLNDVLVAAIAAAAHEVWPQPDDAPIVIDMPVSLREEHDDVSDRAGPFRFRLPARITRDFKATLAAVCQHTRAARTRTPSIVQTFGATLPSYLPPSMFDAVVGGFFRANPTGGDSLCISNVGTLSGRLRDFGPLPLTDAFIYANACGLRVMVIPSPRGLQLTFSYFAPLIADEKVARIIALVGERLANVQSALAA